METIKNENKLMKETSLDLQSRSIRDNLVFSGITDQPQEDLEHTIKEFMQSMLKLPHDTVNNITFHRVHRIGVKNNSNRYSHWVCLGGLVCRDVYMCVWMYVQICVWMYVCVYGCGCAWMPT